MPKKESSLARNNDSNFRRTRSQAEYETIHAKSGGSLCGGIRGRGPGSVWRTDWERLLRGRQVHGKSRRFKNAAGEGETFPICEKIEVQRLSSK